MNWEIFKPILNLQILSFLNNFLQEYLKKFLFENLILYFQKTN